MKEMKEHEREHYEFFDNEIKKRNIEPTKLLPLWDLMGVTLGFGTAMLGEKAAMLCTASVEEVIDGHYKDQTYKLGKDEEELKRKIIKFRQDELDHRDIAYDNGATKKGLFGVSKTKTRVFFSAGFEGTDSTSKFLSGSGFISGLAPTVNMDSPVWVTPVTIEVDGDYANSSVA